MLEISEDSSNKFLSNICDCKIDRKQIHQINAVAGRITFICISSAKRDWSTIVTPELNESANLPVREAT